MNIIKRLFGLEKKYLTPREALNIRFFGGQLVPYNNNKATFIEKGYQGNDIIYAIVNLIRETAKIAPWAPYKVIDEGSYKSYKQELTKPEPDFKKAMYYRKKALELYESDEQLNELLKYPNPSQTFAELNGELWTYKLVTGDYFEYWEGVPSGGLNAGLPKTLSALPAHYMIIKSTTTLPVAADKYYLQLGQMVEFDTAYILHEKYPFLTWDTFGVQLYGMSPLQPASKRLQRNNESQRAGAVAAANGGMRGVAFYDDERLDPNDDRTFEQMGKEKKTFQNEMRPGTDGTGHVFWSQYRVGYQQLGFSPKDLDISTLEMSDLRQFCADYGVPSQLLNDSAAKTYNTTVEAEKALITRCVLPLLNARRDSFNRKMNRRDNVIIDFDLSVYDQLQPNKDAIATWVNKMPLTNARKLEIIGEDIPETMTDDQRNAILIPTGMQALDDVILPMPEDQSNDVNALEQRGLNPYK